MSESQGEGQLSASHLRQQSNQVAWVILGVVLAFLVAMMAGLVPRPGEHAPAEVSSGHGVAAAAEGFVPAYWAVIPFVGILLSIAVLPLIPATSHWWEHNKNKLTVALILSVVTLAYYGFLHPGGVPDHLLESGTSVAGWSTIKAVFVNAILSEYVPFIILLFSLYVISGGINLKGDLPAHPGTNCLFLGAGAVLASLIGTTGSAMVFIRPLLATNAERRNKVHTVIFFIFIVCNAGGLLLPIGDPPLFLGYLRGVPFLWTLRLWPYWLAANGALLLLYFIWDTIAYRREPSRSIALDESRVQPLRLTGKINLLLILGVVFSVGLIVPGEPFLGTGFVPPLFFREAVMLLFVVASLRLTEASARYWNRFNYTAIAEVAALFFGIFICMQVPIEILHARGPSLGLSSPLAFFWASGGLSSFLDNAPTYVVFFETAISLPVQTGVGLLTLAGGREIMLPFLTAVSLGSVLMGANTYIGNGPNFMVKSIAEQSGVKMPSFFGYMGYSIGILVPIWIVFSFVL